MSKQPAFPPPRPAEYSRWFPGSQRASRRIVRQRGRNTLRQGFACPRALGVLCSAMLLAGLALNVVAVQQATAQSLAQSAPLFAQAAPEVIDDDAQLDALAEGEQDSEPAAAMDEPSGIDLITLIGRGGDFMWPIGLMSLLVVTLAVERVVSFRRGRMIPGALTQRLSRLIEEGGADLDAEAALQACRQHPSVAANVIQAMLLRAGRPLGEIEQAASETAQREADDQAGPIRWLNLAAAATPLMGLLGTVWGMIVAFHDSATLTAERSRSEQLSEGIYTALVTTLAGLAVAIPAAIMAQYLENRLTKIFHRIEKLAFSLAPALEHYTGKARMDASARLRATGNGNGGVTPPPVIVRPGDAAGRTLDAAEVAARKR